MQQRFKEFQQLTHRQITAASTTNSKVPFREIDILGKLLEAACFTAQILAFSHRATCGLPSIAV
jgi:hypothetical protein